MKLALDCFCGEYLDGDDEEELLNSTRAHVERSHSEVQLTDEQVCQIVAEGAYETAGRAQEGH
jgi:predicted small metal-binding protein